MFNTSSWLFLFSLTLILWLTDLLWYNSGRIAVLATLEVVTHATWPLKLLLLIRVVSTTAAHAVAVFITDLLRWHIPASHIRHLVPFVTCNFWLINAKLTEIVFKIRIVLEAQNWVLVIYDLSATHVARSELLLVSVYRLVHVGLSTFGLVRARSGARLRLNHATIIIATALVELHWNWL